MSEIIGRKNEIAELTARYNSGKAEFIAVYGRRRVGKTFLIKEFFHNQFAFQHTGLSQVDKASGKKEEQLTKFLYSLQQYGWENDKAPASWLEAFFFLEQLLANKDDGKRQVVFIDELPWMDTPGSGFITALESFWNGWGYFRDNLCLVVCGSATSWMSNVLINNKGGLYGRLTHSIKLEQFTLNECEQYFSQAGIRMSRYDIAESYMAIGGIPYYMSYFEKGLSLAQNIDNLFFKKNAKLKNEFERLFRSVFTSPETKMQIVRALGRKHKGLTREQIAQAIHSKSGGTLTEALKALEDSDFIVKYVPYGYSKRESHYKLIDHFCWFWLHFMEQGNRPENFWQLNENLSSIRAWCGIAFEEVCFHHIRLIKRALGIEGVAAQISAYAVTGDDETDGLQIDMLIDRADRVINVCEMKFVNGDFTVDKSYHRKLTNRLLAFRQNEKKSVHSTLVTTYGLNQNEYSGVFQNCITLDDIFLP